MADPEHDFGIVYDDQGQIQILQSPFFDDDPEVDHTVNDSSIASWRTLSWPSKINLEPLNGALPWIRSKGLETKAVNLCGVCRVHISIEVQGSW
ncbi:hypothetical protein M5K25_025325 [Dendrobium thyrsiflorum]|uniref:Uncharacterized protein n=1 Tax=Dendrobium thyrsiflorum TaxID=117978 RepID=A0ABD0U3T7_DENTH